VQVLRDHLDELKKLACCHLWQMKNSRLETMQVLRDHLDELKSLPVVICGKRSILCCKLCGF
jgi:hypothetical protein